MSSILILGRKNSGKSSLLKVLSKGKINIKPFDINIYAVPKEDERLKELKNVFQSKSITPIHFDFIDYPGSATFSEKNPQLKSYIQKSDLILYLIPAFLEDMDPLEEIKKEEANLILNDLEICERYLKDRKINVAERTLLEKVYNLLMEEKTLNSCDLSLEEIKTLTSWNFLSLKPIFYLINTTQEFIEKDKNKEIFKDYLIFSIPLEEEILDLEDKEALEYLSIFGLDKPIRERVLDRIFDFFDLITFFTGNEKEVKAWKLKRGSPVIQAAEVIHSDIAKGFIRAEVIPWDKLVTAGSWKEAHQRGWILLEKKEYIVKDGDVIYIRFHL